jgi:SAM-dependent methyltransferase
MPDSTGVAAPSRRCHCCGETTRLTLRFVKNGHRVIHCEVCGLDYVDRLPDDAELSEIYGRAFFEVGRKFSGERAGAGLVNAADRAEMILRLPQVGRTRWLDVGCATGDFLACAVDAAGTVTGVELSAYASEQARARGFEVTTADFLDATPPDGSCDVVTMWDYIEHVRDPVANLTRAFHVLAPGGYLALSTGDVSSLSARLTGRFWHLMIPPRHLYFFTPKTLTRMLTTAGFNAVTVTRPGKRVPLDFALWKATSLTVPGLAPPVLRTAGRLGLGRLAPSINLLDIMTVFARRPA